MADNPERLDELKAKLKARENRPGFSANVDSLKKLIADTEGAANGNRN